MQAFLEVSGKLLLKSNFGLQQDDLCRNKLPGCRRDTLNVDAASDWTSTNSLEASPRSDQKLSGSGNCLYTLCWRCQAACCGQQQSLLLLSGSIPSSCIATSNCGNNCRAPVEEAAKWANY